MDRYDLSSRSLFFVNEIPFFRKTENSEQSTCRREVLCKFVKQKNRTGLIRRNATSTTTAESKTEQKTFI